MSGLYDLMLYGSLFGGGGSSVDPNSIVGTWVFNDNLYFNYDIGPIDVPLDFTAYDANGTKFPCIYLSATPEFDDNNNVIDYKVIYWNTNDEPIIVCDSTDMFWVKLFSQIITINKEYTNSDFITWLKANATKLPVNAPDGSMAIAEGKANAERIEGWWRFNDIVEGCEAIEYDCCFISYSKDGWLYPHTYFYDNDGYLTYEDITTIDAYDYHNAEWLDERYKTICICSDPCNEDFATWLRANATKVAQSKLFIRENGVWIYKSEIV